MSRLQHRDQGGFALMVVLGMIALTGILVGVLFGLMALTLKITANHERAERERRASDGAIVATLNHLRLGTLGNGCGPIGTALPGFELPFDVPSGSNKVQVTCEAAADEYGDPAGEVKVVGDGYAGSITNWKTAWPWSTASPAAASAVGDPAFKSSLIHIGSQPLRFNGHVNTAAGAAALRDPASGSPALEMRGQFRQGARGVGATAADCGLLGAPGTPLFVETAAGSQCGDPSVLSAAVEADYAINKDAATLPAESGGCPAGPVVSLGAGKYDQRSVKTLNRWFNGSCPNRTFHFPTGIYWFDANDPAAPAADRNSLIINDASSNFVFGEPKGWSPSVGASPGNFPAACNAGVSATAPGASIVLSGRTSLRHLGGRLAVCPFVSSTNQPYPAILQQKVQPNKVTVSAGAELDFKPAANLVSGDVNATTEATKMSCVILTGESGCAVNKKFEVKLASEASSESLKSVRLGITGDEPNFPVTVVQSRTFDFQITFAAPGPTGDTSCTTGPIDGGIDDGYETSFELLSGNCASRLVDAAQLDGAKVTATITYKYSIYPLSCHSWDGWCGFDPQSLKLWDIGVDVDTWKGSASSAAASGDWTNIDNALVDDNTANVLFKTVCGHPVCASTSAIPGNTDSGSFTLNNVKLTAPLDDVDALQSVGVVLKQKGAEAQGINTATMMGDTTLTLRFKDGQECSKTFPGVVNRQGATYYPMLVAGSDQCGSASWAPSERVAGLLAGASITVKVTLNCITPNGPNCGPGITYMQPVAIQYVGIMATTDAYKGPVTKSQLKVDSTPSGAGSSANFFGSAYLPRTALDIFWAGKHSNMSLFGGELQLWSLGSRMVAGADGDVVCCTKPEVSSHKVRLTAHVAGRPVLSAVAILASDRSRPEVLEWTQCGRNGACAGG